MAASGGLRPACAAAVLRGSAAVKEREEALGDPAESGSPLTLGGGGSWTALHGGRRQRTGKLAVAALRAEKEGTRWRRRWWWPGAARRCYL